jgi:hypothetical protein
VPRNALLPPSLITMTEAKVYTLKDVSSHDFVVEYAQHLKKTGKMEVPKWVDLCKTGPFKELAPYDEDFYFIRAGIYRRPLLPLCPYGRPSAPMARGGADVQPPPSLSGLRPRWPAPGLSTLLSGFQQPAASLPSDPPAAHLLPLGRGTWGCQPGLLGTAFASILTRLSWCSVDRAEDLSSAGHRCGCLPQDLRGKQEPGYTDRALPKGVRRADPLDPPQPRVDGCGGEDGGWVRPPPSPCARPVAAVRRR